MARLRIRIELSRGGIGVPLRKLASVMVESQKFLNLLTEDVRADKPGEWLGFDFDQEILSFTAEYIGPVNDTQLKAFNAAFSGSTSLRRDTIGQFLRITDSIGEDEVVGFGLYEADDAPEPAEWRCLSRRDALRIADEVKVLLGAGQAPHLPGFSDPALGARIFGERRDRSSADTAALERIVAVESGLTTRIETLEGQMATHSGMIRDLRTQSAATETSVLGLLSTFESFCEQATKRIEQMAPPARLEQISAPVTAEQIPAPATAQEEISAPAIAPEPEKPAPRPWREVSILAAALGLALVLIAGTWRISSNLARAKSTAAEPRAVPRANPTPASEPQQEIAPQPVPQPVPQPAPQPAAGPATGPAPANVPPPQPASRSTAMRIDLEATEPTWVSLRDATGKNLLAQMLLPGEPKSVILEKSAVLRVGNAAGLMVRANGQNIGSLGSAGQVREIEFGDGKFKLLPLTQP